MNNFKSGDVLSSNNYGDFVIISYEGYYNVVIKFISTSCIIKARADHVIKGNVRDPLMPFVFGVGFAGIGQHKIKDGKIITKPYNVWKGMIERCYSKTLHAKRPTYAGCTVCDEWHNYQNFADWFDLNYIDGHDLDKDILQRGVENKIYSPTTCCFISAKDNTIEAKAKNYILLNPNGIPVNIYNMTQYCKDNNLDRTYLSLVARGKKDSYKGWTKPKDNGVK